MQELHASPREALGELICKAGHCEHVRGEEVGLQHMQHCSQHHALGWPDFGATSLPFP